MSIPTQQTLDRLIQVRGVRGAMLVSAADGLVVAEASMEDIDGQAVAALTASLVAKLGRATAAAGFRPGTVLHLRGDRGSVLAARGGEELLLVVVADRDADLGLARIELLRAVREVV